MGKYLNYETLQKRYDALSYALSPESLQLLPDYEAKLNVLKKLGYVDENCVVTLKGKVAREIHHQELLVTELMFESFFNHLQPAEIAAALSCTTCQEKNSTRAVVNENLKRIEEDLRKVIDRISAEQKNYHVEEDFAQEINFSLIEVVYEWARGMVSIR